MMKLATYYKPINHSKPQHQSGFSMMELVLVIVLLGILSIYVAPRLIDNQTISLNAASEQMVRDIELTQSLSMGLNDNYYMTINSGSYYINDSAGTRYSHPIYGTSDIASTSGVSFTSSLPSNVLAFNGIGVPYTTSAPLANNATITISTNGNSRRITVYPETGLIILN